MEMENIRINRALTPLKQTKRPPHTTVARHAAARMFTGHPCHVWPTVCSVCSITLPRLRLDTRERDDGHIAHRPPPPLTPSQYLDVLLETTQCLKYSWIYEE
ncbi:hypothetical protein J6590_042847 [Homalodisca vitripennis]|nr:hypothetical protein J6590_042847 [Homalodisca vitripennis]